LEVFKEVLPQPSHLTRHAVTLAGDLCAALQQLIQYQDPQQNLRLHVCMTQNSHSEQ
jgi:hypothetical protein